MRVGQDSALGDMQNRVKTDIRFPRDLTAQMENFAVQLGVPRNVVYTMAVAMFIADMARLRSKKASAKKLLAFIRQRFDEIAARTAALL